MASRDRQEFLDLIPAYAVGALDDDERAAFEAWLARDAEAQALLAEYEAAAEHLVALAPLRPAPSHLQADLRRRLAEGRGDTHPAMPITQTKAGTRVRRRPVWLLAAAMFVVLLLGAILVALSLSSGESTPDSAKLYTELIAQPGATQFSVVAGEVDDSVNGELVVSADAERAVLRVASLPPLSEDQTFQMWLIDPSGARTSAGLFKARASQDVVYVSVPLPQPISAYTGLGVSLEPAGGSPYENKPTGPRVLSVPLS